MKCFFISSGDKVKIILILCVIVTLCGGLVGLKLLNYDINNPDEIQRANFIRATLAKYL